MPGKLFDPFRTPLHPGINLLEASAGTGKTFAIATLALRFVVDNKLDIKKLLVVTFTKAATEELKSRIRNRLEDARRAVNFALQQLADASDQACQTDLYSGLPHKTEQKIDQALLHWLHSLMPASQTSGSETDTELNRQCLKQIQRDIKLALQDIDQASIFTIHGFCQRILIEHALESGQLFDCELTGDISAIKQACADDFWRRTLYQRSAWEVAILTGTYSSPDTLLHSVNIISAQQTVFPEYIDIEDLFRELKTLRQHIAQLLHNTLATIRTAMQDGKFKTTYQLPDDVSNWLGWLNEQDPVVPDFTRLTTAGLLDGLNGQKFRKSKNNPLPPDQQKALYLQQCQIQSQPFDRLTNLLQQIRLHFRLALLRDLYAQLGKSLQQLNQMSFDDLVTRLAAALQGEQGALLVSEVQQRFQVALIDEFQDTDLNQWGIFSSLFSGPERYLYLIGDPKQAIYKFRGADIHTYFAARQQAQHQFSLGRNWRSHPLLVEGVNRLFQKPAPFLFQHPDYQPVEAALTALDNHLSRDGNALEPLMLWQLEQYKDGQEYWTSGKAAQVIRDNVVAEIVDLLNRPPMLKEKNDRGVEQRPLQAGDIAILVRTNPQAHQYQQALSASGVPSVLNSKESVFESSQALNLFRVLQAVSQPGHIPALKQALTVNWFDLDGPALFRLGNDESALDGWITRFQDYLQCWRQAGLMAMMEKLLHQEQVEATVSRQPQAERALTDLHHLLELLQQAVIDEHLGINKTLDWLHRAMTEAARSHQVAETQQLRLESDANAVRILTMHSAKGLEFPVVFCPCLWQRSDRLKKEKNAVQCHQQGRLIADLGSEQFAERKELALAEELAEDLRLFYVAVTRAKLRCYLVWADVRTKLQANESAMAYLFDFKADDFSAQQQKLLRLQDTDGETFAYQLLTQETAQTALYQATSASVNFTCRETRRSLFSHWQMSSYTALSTLSQHETPELPLDKAGENTLPTESVNESEQLPKGAHTGNVLHDLLENIQFSAMHAGKDISAQRSKACVQYGLNTDRPELIDKLLQSVVSTPLSADPGFCLHLIPDAQCLKEMPFYLALKGLDTAEINAVLQHCPVYQPLSSREMSGYLTGFIDLICQYDGLFYVMDYKSNSLENYQPDSLSRAMREHNYGLQYWLYTLVLHHYLKQRLPDYQYETHFGGVKYLFMRGMSEARPKSGVFSDRPSLASIEKLSKIFFPSDS